MRFTFVYRGYCIFVHVKEKKVTSPASRQAPPGGPRKSRTDLYRFTDRARFVLAALRGVQTERHHWRDLFEYTNTLKVSSRCALRRFSSCLNSISVEVP